MKKKRKDLILDYFLRAGKPLSNQPSAQLIHHIFTALANSKLKNKVEYRDNERLGTQFITNFLTLLQKHTINLNSSSTAEEIQNQFETFIRQVLGIAFPKEAADSHLPSPLKTLLNGQGISWIPNYLINSTVQEYFGVTAEKLNWDYFITFLAKTPAKIYATSFKEIKNRDNKTLESYKGIEKLADDIAIYAIHKGRETKKIPFKLDALKLSAESQTLLNTVFAKFLAGRVSISQTMSPQDSSSVEDVVDQSWGWVENTLRDAISKILLTIFQPMSAEPAESDQLFKFIDGLLSRSPVQIAKLNEEIQKIEAKKEEPNAKAFSIKICYHKFAKELLGHELDPRKFEGLFSGLKSIVSIDSILSLIYESAGSYIQEFHECYQRIASEAIQSDKLLRAWQIPELDQLISNTLKNLVNIIEEKANKNELLPEYEFLNKIISRLLSTTTASDESSTNASFKQTIILFAQNVVKVIVVSEIQKGIEKKKKEGISISPQIAFTAIVNETISSANQSLSLMDVEEFNPISNSEDNNKFNGVLQRIYETIQGSPDAQLYEIKHKIKMDWGLNENSEKELLKLISLREQLSQKTNSEEEIDLRIFDRVIEDIYNITKIPNAKKVRSKEEEKQLDEKSNSESFDALKAKLYTDWRLKGVSESVLAKLLPENDFDLLLPTSLRDMGIWHLLSDSLLFPYLRAIFYKQTKNAL